MEIDNIKHENKNEENKLTNVIGELGKWQALMLLVIQFPMFMTMSWMQFGIIFIAPNTRFICVDKNLSKLVVESKCYNDCNNYEYNAEFGNTIISEWDLICDRAWMVQLTQTVLMFGALLGSIVFGFISDRHGRRTAMLVASVLQLCASMAVAFCPTYWTFTTVRFFIGMSSAGGALCAATFIIEITGPSKLEMVNSLVGIAVAVGITTLPIFSYFLRTYDKFCLGMAFPSITYLLYFFIMPESPKWLISMDRLEEASLVIKKAAEWNNLQSNDSFVLNVVKNIALEDLSSRSQEKATYLDLFKSKFLKRTLCCCTIWFMNSITFDGGNQYIGLTSSNAFISISTAGALQIPGAIMSAILCKYLGRRLTLIGLWIVCSISYALLAVYNDWMYFKLAVGSIALTCVGGAFSSIYLFTSELFPTVTRNMALGSSYAVSGVGSMLAPFISGLAARTAWLPPTIFAIAPLFASLACYFLPETKGKKLSDHLD